MSRKILQGLLGVAILAIVSRAVLSQDACACTLIYQPVCDKVTGEKYDNRQCAEDCFGAEPANLGECPPEEPCACITLYDPVCDQTTGQEYSNKECAVSCEGADAGSLGPCGAKAVEPLGEPQESCICQLDFRPVCDENNTPLGPNKCAAECDGYTPEQILPCKPSQPANPKQDDCICTFEYMPVCSTTRLGAPIGANACVAKCQGYDESQFKLCFPEESLSIVAFQAVDECTCPAIYAPVCDRLGNEVAPSSCDADCKDIKDYAPCEDFSGHADVIPPAGEPKPEPCMATMEYAPVCTSNGKEVAPNKGTAICKGYTEEQLELCNRPEEPQGPVTPEADCVCTMDLLPMCLPDGTEVGANPCVADCNGYAGQVVPCAVIQTSKPSVPVDVTPKPPCKCTREYDPQCDVNTGVEVAPNPCNARCSGFTDNQVESCNAPEKPFVDRSVSGLCPCTRDLRPVCDALGTEVGPNACTAECKGYAPEDFSEENCAVVPPPCDEPCTRNYEPVCDPFGTEVGPNACTAECNGYEPSDFSEEYCTKRYIRSAVVTNAAANGPCMCTMEIAPVCGIDSTWTMPNACAARCAGYDDAEFAPCQIITLPEPDSTGDAPAGTGEDATRQTVCIQPQVATAPLLCAQYDSTLGSNETDDIIEDKDSGVPSPGASPVDDDSAAAGFGPSAAIGILAAGAALAKMLLL